LLSPIAGFHTLYTGIPINHLIPLAFHTTPVLLETFQDLDSVVDAVSKQYGSDLFSDWQKYCKNLDLQQRAAATFEGAIFFAAQTITGPKEREDWTSSCLNLLRLLKRLIAVNEGEESGRKRKRPAETTVAPVDSSLGQTSIGLVRAQGASQIKANKTNVAVMADVAKLERILGGYLFNGMDVSRARQREKGEGMERFTGTVRLHLAVQEGEDFKLEVWTCPSSGEAILEARSVEDLRSKLGDYLFEAMEASNWRKQEKPDTLKPTGAVEVSFLGGDSKLGIMLCFVTGKEMYAEVFPS